MSLNVWRSSKVAQRPNARSRAGALERVAQRLRVDQIEPVGLVHSPLEGRAPDARREVDQRAGDVRHGNAIAEDAVLRQHRDAAMRADARSAPGNVQRERYVDEAGAVRDDTPERSGALVAQHRGGTTREQRRRPASVPAQVRSADGIDTSPAPSMEPAVGQPVPDRLGAEAESQQLRTRDRPVLAPSELPAARTHPLKASGVHDPLKPSMSVDSPPGPRWRPGGPATPAPPACTRAGSPRRAGGGPPRRAGCRSPCPASRGPCPRRTR